MTDPTRWREDDTELSADARRLLHAGLRPNVPRGAKRAVWIALGAQLPSALAAASAASTSTLTAVGLVKSASIGLLLGATAVGAVAVVQHEPAAPHGPTVHAPAPISSSAGPSQKTTPTAPISPVPLAEPSAASASPTRPARPVARVAVELPPTVSPRAPAEAAFPDESAAVPDAESRRVAGARQLLRAGRTREALTVLEQAKREFPNGALAQEREALTIEALRAVGATAEARRRAAAFLAEYPQSPHAPTARRALE